MSGRPQIEIKESLDELRALLKQQKTALNQESSVGSLSAENRNIKIILKLSN